MATVITQTAPAAATAARKPFYKTLWGQVLLGVAIAIVLGYVAPTTAQAMRPLGDAFIRLITMVISLVIFCTVAAGIAGMEGIAGSVAGRAPLAALLTGTPCALRHQRYARTAPPAIRAWVVVMFMRGLLPR